MKKPEVLFLFAACFFLMGLSACSKGGVNKPTTGGSIVFKTDSTTVVTLLYPMGTYGLNTGGFEVTAQNTAAASIQLAIPQNFTAGRYDIASGKAEISYTPSSDYSANGGTYAYKATSGTVVINGYTTTGVQGTFAFHGKNALGDTVNVTGGVFVTPYTRASSIPVTL